MVIIQRWEPTLSPAFPNQIPFWIQVQGVPLHLWSTEILERIAYDIGTYDLSEITNTMTRMRVFINGLQPLIRKSTLEFDDGRELEVNLVYEKLQNHCTTCLSLCHDKNACPLKVSAPEKPLEIHNEGQPAEKIRPPSQTAPRGASNYSRSHLQSYHKSSSQNTRISNSGRDNRSGPERRHKSYERRAEPYKGYNPPSTERTITARGSPRDRPRYEHRRREESTNTYQSREYRRYEQTESRRGHQRPQPSRSLWVEKPTQRDYNPQLLEKTESSRPSGPTLQNNRVPSRSMDMPEEAISQARDEIRGYMVQYTNCQDPTESAARKERLRQAEEQGEIEEAADRLARSNMVPNGLQITEPFPEVSPARTPIAQRLGSISESQSAFDRLGPRGSPQDQDPLPQSAQQHQKRRVGKPHLRRTTPLSLTMINAGLRKRKVLKAAKISKTIPRNEENSIRNIPPREENKGKNKSKRPHGNGTGPSSRPTHSGPSNARPSRRAAGGDFQNPPCPLP